MISLEKEVYIRENYCIQNAWVTSQETRILTFQKRGSRLGSDGDSSEQKQVQLLFPNLSTLDLSNTALNTLPAELSEQSQLTELKISQNRLKEVGSSLHTPPLLVLCSVAQPCI